MFAKILDEIQIFQQIDRHVGGAAGAPVVVLRALLAKVFRDTGAELIDLLLSHKGWTVELLAFGDERLDPVDAAQRGIVQLLADRIERRPAIFRW